MYLVMSFNINKKNKTLVIHCEFSNAINMQQMLNRTHRINRNKDKALNKLNHQISSIRKARNF